MSTPSPGTDRPILARLNSRGFRLVMLLDGAAILGLAVGSMWWRYGLPPWPTYPTGAYTVSFAVSPAMLI